MIQALRIAVADDELDIRDYFQQVLPRLGHLVIAVAKDGHELVEQYRTTAVDLVITDFQMPGLDGIAASIRVYQLRPVPVILVTANEHSNGLECADTDHIMAFLSKPVKQKDLVSAIALAMDRFEQRLFARPETPDLDEI